MTNTIERFTKSGIKLSSGEELDADIIVTATGLNLQLFGGAAIKRNGVQIELNDTMAYKGMMLTAHAEHGFHDRLHQCIVDAEGRPGLRVLLPRAQLHGRQGLRHRRAAAPGQHGRPASADGLHAWLRAARVGLSAQGRACRAVAAEAELPAGSAASSGAARSRRGAGVHQTPRARRLLRPDRPRRTTTMPSSSL